MPICTNCTFPSTFLYTVYETAHNLRLHKCSQCHEFVDPYVEHDSLVLLLDLILLKRGVYRHLLFNRDYPPRRLIASSSTNLKQTSTDKDGDHDTPEANVGEIQNKRDKDRWMSIFRIGLITICIDAFIRWSHLHPLKLHKSNDPWDPSAFDTFPRIFIGCLLETVAFHVGITVACLIVLRVQALWQTFMNIQTGSQQSSISKEFRVSHVPLTLLYSSFMKIFLLLLLSIWRPTDADSTRVYSRWIDESGHQYLQNFPIVQSALRLFDKDILDHEWVVRNLLGGMAGGFGLRVALDIHPVFTTLIILIGWAVKTLAANSVLLWFGDNEHVGEVFLQYSIP